MAEEEEDSSATTDSQNSTSSIVSFIHKCAPYDMSSCGKTVAELETFLQSNNPSSLGVESQIWNSDRENYPGVFRSGRSYCNDAVTATDTAYSTDGILGMDDCVDEQHKSPADSGYCSVSNVGLLTLSGSDTGVPQRKQHPGFLKFCVYFTEFHNASVSKTVPSTYSKDLEKLFVKMDIPCTIKFSSLKPPEGSRIRTMIVFAADEHVSHPVKRCMHHIREDKSAEVCLLQVLNHTSSWSEWHSGHHSVVTPYVHPKASDESFSVQYKFGCRSSCPGGINRRSTYMIFTLEDCDGKVLGRDRVLLKVCSCPGRDRLKELDKYKRQANGATSTAIPDPATRKRRLQDQCPGYRLLCVREEHFQFLSQLNNTLNLSADLSMKQV